MAITWKFDRLGTRGTRTASGWETSMLGIAQGVTGVQSFEKIFEATNLNNGCPQIGDNHPAIPTAYLQRIEVVGITSEQVSARFFYKERWTDRQITVSTVVVQEESNVDLGGDVLTVIHTYADDYKLNSSVAGQTIEQGGLVTRFVPHTTLRFDIRQNVTPEFLASVYTGTINESDWRDLGDTGQWLCTNITGASADSGINWDNTYEFQRRLAGWEGTVIFIDPNSGKPPGDIAEEGKRVFDNYEVKNFNELPL